MTNQIGGMTPVGGTIGNGLQPQPLGAVSQPVTRSTILVVSLLALLLIVGTGLLLAAVLINVLDPVDTHPPAPEDSSIKMTTKDLDAAISEYDTEKNPSFAEEDDCKMSEIATPSPPRHQDTSKDDCSNFPALQPNDPGLLD